MLWIMAYPYIINDEWTGSIGKGMTILARVILASYIASIENWTHDNLG